MNRYDDLFKRRRLGYGLVHWIWIATAAALLIIDVWRKCS